MIKKLEEAMGTYMMTLSPLVAEIYKMSKEITQKEISFKGEKNLLKCDDFDKNEIIEFLDNKKEIARLFDSSFSGLHVMFSPEDDGFVINNSSIITSQYQKGGKPAGTIGLIGPMRIDYAKFIPYLEYFTSRISDMISESDYDEENIMDISDVDNADNEG